LKFLAVDGNQQLRAAVARYSYKEHYMPAKKKAAKKKAKKR
jgi:hypothetical protein